MTLEPTQQVGSMGTKHSSFLDEYLAYEAYPDSLARTVRREFERAVHSDAQKALERLKSGDAAKKDRNENFILGALPAEVQIEARLFLYGPFLAASALAWQLVTDVDQQAVEGLRALTDGARTTRQSSSDAAAPKSASRAASTSSAAGAAGAGAGAGAGGDDDESGAARAPSKLPRPTTAAVSKAQASPLLCSLVGKIHRQEVGDGCTVVGPGSERGLYFLRRGTLRVAGTGDDVVDGVVGPGACIEVGMVMEDEVVMSYGDSNERITCPRSTFHVTATTSGAVYGLATLDSVRGIVRYAGACSFECVCDVAS